MNLFKKIKRKSWFYIIQIFVLILAFFLVRTEILESLNLEIFWQLTHIRNVITEQDSNAIENKDKITIVWIDEKFFNKESISIQWLHRGYYAEAIKNIKSYDPYALWVDVLFEKPFEFSAQDERSQQLTEIFNSYDKDLAKNLSDKVVLASMYNQTDSSFVKPDSLFMSNSPQIWHINSKVHRWYDIWLRVWLGKDNENNSFMNPFSSKVYNLYEKSNKQRIYWQWAQLHQEIEETKDFLNIWNLRIPKVEFTNRPFIFTPVYEINPRNFNYVSLYDIYKNEGDVWSYFEDKIVFIWATDPALQDIKPSLMWSTPWVMFHANTTLAMMNEDFIYTPNKSELFWIAFGLVLLNIFILIIFKFSGSYKFIFYLLLSELLLLILIWITFSILWIFYWTTSVFLPLGTLFLVIFLQLLLTSIYYIMEVNVLKENFQKLFGLYVGKNLSKEDDEIWQKQAKKKEISIYFSDIAWFTETSEKLTPEENIQFLNIYLEKMSENISLNKWFIDKYIWDAVMAFWEDNNACYLAAKSAVLNIKWIEDINKEVKQKMNQDINLQTRIWLHYWNAIVWDIWSEEYKLNYTIIWDNVNLAARLEWINKFYQTNICASGNFIKNIKDKTDFLYRKIDRIQVKWKKESVEIYEILPVFKKTIWQEHFITLDVFIQKFEKGLHNYFEWNFEKAIEIFNETKEIKSDPTTDIFIQRCEILLQDPPKKWDWVWTYKEK